MPPRIEYSLEPSLTVDEFVDLLHRSGLGARRPIDDPQTIKAMLNHATIILVARLIDDVSHRLVGVSRAISDGVYCTYLSDLAVDRQYQGQGIGQQLLRRTHLAAGGNSQLILLAAPNAASFYDHIGLQPHSSCWIQPPIGPQPEEPFREASSESPPRVTSQRQPDPSESSAFFRGTKSMNISDATESGTESLGSSSSGELADFFDGISDEYGQAIQRCVPRYAEMLWAIFEYLPDSRRNPKRVLELGCGTGNLSELIARHFPTAELTLVDLSDSSLETCRSRISPSSNVEYVHRDFRELEFPGNYFDLILSTISLHHLNSSEKMRLFADCYNWLIPGGILSYGDQFSAVAADVYQRHMENWKACTQSAGASSEEWQMWMEHQEKHDFHDPLPDQLDWLRKSGFDKVDCTWRHLLWIVVQARRM